MDTRLYANPMLAALLMAADERHQKDIALARQRRLIRESEKAFGSPSAPTTTVRQALGMMLIKFGRRLQGAGLGATEMTPAHGR